MTSPYEIFAPGQGDSALVARFYRAGDRYRHVIELFAGDGRRELLRSVEGDDTDDWPPSPPLQQLHLEKRDGGDVLFGIGMAGRSHWSLSVAARGHHLHFDVACRLHDDPVRLGSVYDSQASWMPWEEGGIRSGEILLDGGFQQVGGQLELRPPSHELFPTSTITWSYSAGFEQR